MKMMTHRAANSSVSPFEINAIKDHLRVDFTEDDTEIINIAQTAALEIEHYAQIALLTQTIRVTIFDPDRKHGLNLPIGPVLDGEEPTVTIDGQPFTAFEFESGNRPYINWQAPYQNLTPSRVMIEYQAGFGTAASDIPSDLAQAVMDQAALHYDGRSPMDAKSLTTSPHMARIGARYRGVQV